MDVAEEFAQDVDDGSAFVIHDGMRVCNECPSQLGPEAFLHPPVAFVSVDNTPYECPARDQHHHVELNDLVGQDLGGGHKARVIMFVNSGGRTKGLASRGVTWDKRLFDSALLVEEKEGGGDKATFFSLSDVTV